MKRRRKPESAPIGSVWEMKHNNHYLTEFYAMAVVLDDASCRTGNYPMLMLDCSSSWTTRPGQRFNAAVTTAPGWTRVL